MKRIRAKLGYLHRFEVEENGVIVQKTRESYRTEWIFAPAGFSGQPKSCKAGTRVWGIDEVLEEVEARAPALGDLVAHR